MIYRALARMYRYTPQQIADMTPAMQRMLLDVSAGDKLSFETEADYDRWVAQKLHHGR